MAGVGNVYDWYMAIGDVTTDPPGTLGDFPTPYMYSWSNFTFLDLKIAPGGTSLILTGLLSVNSTPGAACYVAIFRGSTPDVGDVPVACAGPFIVDAT